MTRTFENVLLALCRSYAFGDETSGASADCRIGDDAVGSAYPRRVVKFARFELYDQDLVQPRAVADHRRVWILRPRSLRRAAELEVTGRDDVAFMLPFGDNKKIACLRSLITAGLIFRDNGFRRQTRAGGESR